MSSPSRWTVWRICLKPYSPDSFPLVIGSLISFGLRQVTPRCFSSKSAAAVLRWPSCLALGYLFHNPTGHHPITEVSSTSLLLMSLTGHRYILSFDVILTMTSMLKENTQGIDGLFPCDVLGTNCTKFKKNFPLLAQAES
jgi:hypothetical protein